MGGEKIILRELRFIALVIIYERIVPLAPTSVPTIISRVLSRLKPTKTVHHPDREFNTEMIIGISAPPIGRVKKNPHKHINRANPKTYSKPPL